jgi:hypothetical protein
MGAFQVAVCGRDAALGVLVLAYLAFEDGTQANLDFLASPPLVVAYALAGSMSLDLTTEPLGTDKDGNPVFFKDIWPTTAEIAEIQLDYASQGEFADAIASVKRRVAGALAGSVGADTTVSVVTSCIPAAGGGTALAAQAALNAALAVAVSPTATVSFSATRATVLLPGSTRSSATPAA